MGRREYLRGPVPKLYETKRNVFICLKLGTFRARNVLEHRTFQTRHASNSKCLKIGYCFKLGTLQPRNASNSECFKLEMLQVRSASRNVRDSKRLKNSGCFKFQMFQTRNASSSKRLKFETLINLISNHMHTTLWI